MRSHNDYKDSILTMLSFMVALFVVGIAIGYINGESKYRKEAVEHHAAYWEVDASGNSTFHWNDEKGGAK